MRKHILSGYSEKKNVSIEKLVNEFYQGKTTYETSSLENTDVDEFSAKETTVCTETLENSDEDSFANLATKETRSIETSDTDVDEFVFL